MTYALSAQNIALATLQPMGGTMLVPAFGRHAGRKVALQDVTDGVRRFIRATLDGVMLHVPAGTLSDDQIVQMACEQVAV